jgi:hypothetical protein
MHLSPSPFVNKPWNPPIQSWPGVSGSGTGNWLEKNELHVDPTLRTAIQERAGSVFPPKLVGGKRRKLSIKGGMPGLLSGALFGMNSAYSNLVGAATMPVNPAPWSQFPNLK